MTRTALLLASLGLAACTTTTVTVPPTNTADTCGAAQLQTLVGQPASVLETMRFSQNLRVIQPGMSVTMDYNAERLNIEIGQNEQIIRVACG